MTPLSPRSPNQRVIEGCRFPVDMYYHKEHSWARVEEDGSVRVGMDDFFQKVAGVIIYVKLPREGSRVEQGVSCGKIQSSKWISGIVSPVSGNLVAVNHSLEEDSTLVNSQPYRDGWIMVVKPVKLEEDLHELMRAEQLDEWLRKETKKARAEIDKRKSRRGLGRF